MQNLSGGTRFKCYPGPFSSVSYTTSHNDDEYLCDKEVAYMLKVSRRTLSEYRSNGTLPYYVLGGKVLYKRSEIEQALKREYNGKYLMNGCG